LPSAGEKFKINRLLKPGSGTSILQAAFAKNLHPVDMNQKEEEK
jgi:hypothetical protein